MVQYYTLLDGVILLITGFAHVTVWHFATSRANLSILRWLRLLPQWLSSNFHKEDYQLHAVVHPQSKEEITFEQIVVFVISGSHFKRVVFVLLKYFSHKQQQSSLPAASR